MGEIADDISILSDFVFELVFGLGNPLGLSVFAFGGVQEFGPVDRELSYFLFHRNEAVYHCCFMFEASLSARLICFACFAVSIITVF